jgi:hypothetical protein
MYARMYGSKVSSLTRSFVSYAIVHVSTSRTSPGISSRSDVSTARSRGWRNWRSFGARGKMFTASKLRRESAGSRKQGGPADGTNTRGATDLIAWATLLNLAIIFFLAIASYVSRGYS